MRLSAIDYLHADTPLQPIVLEIAVALTDAGIVTADQAERFLASLAAQAEGDDDLHRELRREADERRELIESSFDVGESDHPLPVIRVCGDEMSA